MATCPNKLHPDFQKLVDELGSEALATAAWNRIDLADLPNTKTTEIENQIKENQKLVQGKTDDEKFYIIDNEEYKRVTNVIPNSFDGDTTLYDDSRIAGRKVDDITRDFFNNGDITIPEGITKGAHDNIIDALQIIKKDIDEKGERFFANNIVLFDKIQKIAGEVDILSIDKDGNFHIYDIKTAKDFSKYDKPFRPGQQSKRDSHTNQLSAYSNLFFNQYGIKPSSLKIIPFQISYDNRGYIESAEKINDKPIIYNPEISKLIPTSETPDLPLGYVSIEDMDSLDKPPVLPVYDQQTLSLAKRVRRLKKELIGLNVNDPRYISKKYDAEQLQQELDTLAVTPSREKLTKLGLSIINDAGKFIDVLESGNVTKIKDSDQNYVREIIKTWENYADTATEARLLNEKFQKTIRQGIVNKGNQFDVLGREVTITDYDSQDRDINYFTGGTGSLVDNRNLIAKTIGLTITHAQNKVGIQNRTDNEEINKELDLLEEYTKKIGSTEDKVFEKFQEEYNNTNEIVKQFTKDGKENAKWTEIQNTPELKRFYDYFRNFMDIKQDISGYHEGGKDYIPNLTNEESGSMLKRLNPFKTRIVGKEDEHGNRQDTGHEEYLNSDLVPLRYNKKLPSSIKSKHLGTALISFAMYANHMSVMSEILPGLRLTQEYMKTNLKNPSEQRQYRTSYDSNKLIDADKTNLYKMIDTIIDMQVMGNMKSGKAKTDYGGVVIDSNGNLIQKYIDWEGLGDHFLQYNSLLRIGFSPISGGANVLFGDITNILEAIGGRYLTWKGLLQASKIYLQQVWDEKSPLYTMIHELNFLQELDDWNYLDEVKRTGKYKGLSAEKLSEMAFYFQKSGEKWIQTRMGMGIMIKDGYLNGETGQFTDKYNKASVEEKQRITDKIQRVNHQNHGRYTTKEAAAWQQNILFRMIFQFRKYIPAAIENRMGLYNPYDTRLMGETEGRYRTAGRLFFGKVMTDPKQAFENLLSPIMSYQKTLEKGNLKEYEIYNMRKNIAEIIIATASVVLYMGIRKMGDDEERKKRLQNPVIKSTLLMLDRASGDLTYFYNPMNVTSFTTNIAPASKLLTDLAKTVNYAALGYPLYVGNWEYTSGSNEGKNKFYKTAKQIIPLAKPTQDIFRLLSDKILEEQK